MRLKSELPSKNGNSKTFEELEPSLRAWRSTDAGLDAHAR
jgi:hypothetical protein